MAAGATDSNGNLSTIAGSSNDTSTSDIEHDRKAALSKLWAWWVAKAEAARLWAANAFKADKEQSSKQADKSTAP